MQETISLNWAKAIKAHGYQSGNKTASDVTESRHWRNGQWKTVVHNPGDLINFCGVFQNVDAGTPKKPIGTPRCEKLKEHQVRFIRENYGKGEVTIRKMAKDFKVSVETIVGCANGKRYKRFNETIPPVKL